MEILRGKAMKNFEFEFWTTEERKPEESEISRTRTLHWFDLHHDSRHSISDSDRMIYL